MRIVNCMKKTSQINNSQTLCKHPQNIWVVEYSHNMRNYLQEKEMMDKNNNTFQYTYSAPQNEEVKKIREKYLPREETKMEQLRRLDESTTKKGMACSLTLGIAGALILGIGMCCAMLWERVLFGPGILIGCIGIAGMILAYPLNANLTKKERERLAPEILKLTSELMNGQA